MHRRSDAIANGALRSRMCEMNFPKLLSDRLQLVDPPPPPGFDLPIKRGGCGVGLVRRGRELQRTVEGCLACVARRSRLPGNGRRQEENKGSWMDAWTRRQL
ncbi:hypothetical protein NDU88_007624 [Pleurodeles waltl]|uniref:Uncharacterized protein n=1 Tax=Pleurodeles waltl TaxID=8319 RepID=A0AAV7U0A4_PLEWA|nr:hypothetical protein NDU88_007624 [Pleurodeles waltl]